MILSGHEQAWEAWRSAMAGARMHHAWMLAGREGIGKMGFALAAARELVAEPGVPQPEGRHPDIIVLKRPPKDEKEERKREEGKPFDRKRNISVDQIRTMQQRLATRPTLGSRRAIILDPADDLEKGAANALLKSLEEPPAGTFFLLVTHRPGRLLPTIRSRCRVLRFPDLPDAALEEVLRRQAPDCDPATLSAAVTAAAGSPGVALRFVELGLGALHQLMLQILATGDRDLALRGRIATIGGARPSLDYQRAALELARKILAGALRESPRARLPGIIAALEELDRLAAEVAFYNYDPGLLLVEIGTLLANAAGPRGSHHG